MIAATWSDELLAALRLFPPPRRILSVEPEAAGEVGALFPGAAFRGGTLRLSSDWAGWPDLLWFGSALCVVPEDAAAAVRSAWRALPDGAIVVAFEPARDREVGAALRACFAILATVEPDAASSARPGRALIGVKAIDRDW